MIACCLAATLTLRPTLLTTPAARRSGQIFSQAAWLPSVDEASGRTYYFNEETGVSQWDPPQGYGAARASLRLVPEAGAYSPLRRGGLGLLQNGEHQVLGRYDMVEQSPYVSRAQCAASVTEDGVPTLASLGKPSTLVREYDGGKWYGIRAGETHTLADGMQICLAGETAWTAGAEAVFTCRCRVKGADTGSISMGDDVVQYSEDGLWMWNGAEWSPSPQ
eukprot:6758829-Prymnesium_polylepis.1